MTSTTPRSQPQRGRSSATSARRASGPLAARHPGHESAVEATVRGCVGSGLRCVHTTRGGSTFLRTHLLPRFGTTPLKHISHLDVREMVTHHSAEGLAPSTVHRAHQVLNKLLRAAIDARLIAVNPAGRVPLPRIERIEMWVLDPGEIRRLVAATPERYRAMVLFDACFGLRLGELERMAAAKHNDVR